MDTYTLDISVECPDGRRIGRRRQLTTDEVDGYLLRHLVADRLGDMVSDVVEELRD